ncbi:unnamed protein product [Choristocarpus tenellus]
MSELKPFVLAAEIIGHEGPVRAVHGLADGRLASASQDATARVWIPRGKDGSANMYFDMEGTLSDHNHWVIALTSILAGVLPDCPQGGLVTGCLDKVIRVYDHMGKLQRKLTGHEGGVISFSWTVGGQLISGSWDGTAKVWDVAAGTCMATLGGHENGVCVLGLPDGKVNIPPVVPPAEFLALVP